jgi:hypothetical protein
MTHYAEEEVGIPSQIRIGHTLLNDSLARIGAEQSADCTCEMGVESIQASRFAA